MAVEVKALKCPSCGAGLPSSNGNAECEYCRNEYVITGTDIKPAESPRKLDYPGVGLPIQTIATSEWDDEENSLLNITLTVAFLLSLSIGAFLVLKLL